MDILNTFAKHALILYFGNKAQSFAPIDKPLKKYWKVIGDDLDGALYPTKVFDGFTEIYAACGDLDDNIKIYVVYDVNHAVCYASIFSGEKMVMMLRRT